VTAFELNEDLKDRCMACEGLLAVTLYFKNGVPIIPESFYETTIVFTKDCLSENISKAIMDIHNVLELLGRNKFSCTDVILEFKNKYPKVVYTIYSNELSFKDRKLKYTD
jgi:hypothetical protein